MMTSQIQFNNAFVAGLPKRTFEDTFLAGLIHRESEPKSIPLSKDTASVVTAGPQTIKLRVGESVYLGKKGSKQYKITLEEFNEGVLILKTIDVSHGVGHVILKSRYLKTSKKEVAALINKEL